MAVGQGSEMKSCRVRCRLVDEDQGLLRQGYNVEESLRCDVKYLFGMWCFQDKGEC